MKTNPNDLISGTSVVDYALNTAFVKNTNNGLTKREYAAIHIMSNTDQSRYPSFEMMAKSAVEKADALINALNE